MCPSLRIHGQRRCGIYAMEYYSTSKMKVSLSFPTTWMNHIHSEGYISEIRQTKKKKKSQFRETAEKWKWLPGAGLGETRRGG